MNDLTKQHPVRRSPAEKEAFRQAAVRAAVELGWTAAIEETSKARQKNVVIGHPDSAVVIFTAHYDTPANMLLPALQLPGNAVLYVLWQVLVIALLLVLGFGADLLAGVFTADPRIRAYAFIGVYVLLLVLMSYGFANRNNANESTGIDCVFDMLQQLPAEERGKCAFVLFDGRWRGCRGSKGYARDHMELAYMRMFLNLDWLGAGNELQFIPLTMARRCTGYRTLERVLKAEAGGPVRVLEPKMTLMGGDHRAFKCGIEAVMGQRLALGGAAVTRIATARDKVASAETVSRVSNAMIRAVTAIGKDQ